MTMMSNRDEIALEFAKIIIGKTIRIKKDFLSDRIGIFFPNNLKEIIDYGFSIADIFMEEQRKRILKEE